VLDQIGALPLECEVVVVHAGAAYAGGAWLWFLHADSRLTPGCIPAMLALARHGQPALGWFPLAFHGDGPALMRLNARGANLRFLMAIRRRATRLVRP